MAGGVGPNSNLTVDIIGSTQTQGVSTLRHDHARRVFKVTDLTNDHLMLGQAIQEVYNFIGPRHHSLFFMPLAYITAERFGPTVAWVEAVYQRGRSTAPVKPAVEIASYRPANAAVPVYRNSTIRAVDGTITSTNQFDKGLPSGDFHGMSPAQTTNPLRRPKPYIFDRNAQRIAVPTVLSYNPYRSGIGRLEGKTNEDTVRIGTQKFAPNTLRFEGAVIDWFASNIPANIFHVQYHFLGFVNGLVGGGVGAGGNTDYQFIRQELYWHQTALEWRTDLIDQYPRTPMEGKFPYHTVVP